MRFNHLFLMVCMICFGLLTGCPGLSSSERQALNPYAEATLTPGTGLGDIQLGKTTLGWFVQNIGSGTVSVLVSDEVAIELSFLNDEASFLFIISGACQRETGAPMKRLDLSQDIRTFLARYPGCNELPLSSLSVAMRRRQANTFFQGRTDRGVQLGSPKAEAYRHGTALDRPGQLVAGEGQLGENLGRLEFPGGIYFYYPEGKGATAQEMQSGRPLSPERLREIEESAREAAKNAVIKRITIFIPNA